MTIVVMGAVVFAAGWLAKDYWERHLSPPEPVQRPTGPRVVP